MSDAKTELEHALGIDGWRPSDDNISVKTFSAAMNAGRIDAEYFQPKHDKVLERLKSLGKFERASELLVTGLERVVPESMEETLLLIFKSWPVQLLLKRGCSGTILTGISAAELERIPIPILPQKVQDSLADKVRKAFALRRESRKLIAEAKQMVEDAIEGKVV